MIDALVGGKLIDTPTQRSSKTGNHFTVAKVWVSNGEEAVICFSEGCAGRATGKALWHWGAGAALWAAYNATEPAAPATKQNKGTDA